MYINSKLVEAKGLLPFDVVIFQLIFQNKFEDNSKILEQIWDSVEKYENQGWVKYIQGTKKQTKYHLVRLSDKGSKILDEIQIPEVNEDDLDVYTWLEGVYKNSGKEIGNAKKTKLWISQFRVHSGIERNHLAYLCKVFINDEKEMEWSKKLEFLFFKPGNMFVTKFDIDQSRLYQYFLLRKEAFEAKFKNIKN